VAHSSFDPSLYPRTYQASIRTKFFLVFVGGLVAVGGLLGALYFGTGHEMKSLSEEILFVIVSFVFLVLGSYLMLTE